MKAQEVFRFRRVLGIVLVMCGLMSSLSCYQDFADDIPDRTPAPEVQLTLVGAKALRLGESVQLSAWRSDGTQPEVRWKVNGLSGGTEDVGTISTNGLYTAPLTMPSPDRVMITAVTAAAPHLTSDLLESLLNPVPKIDSLLISPIAPEPSYVLDVQGEGFVEGSRIQVGGIALPTTFVSRYDLQTTTIFRRGESAVSVSVMNPAPGPAISASATAPIQTMRSAKQLWEP